MAIPMHAAENMDMNDTWCSVRGSDMTMPMSVTMTEKETVQSEWSESVFNTFAPVRTWNPMSIMLFARSMNAVKW